MPEFAGGHEGSLTITRPSGSPITINYTGEFTITSTFEVTTKGPHIGGGGTVYKAPGAKDWTFEIAGDVPRGRDPGQTALLDAHDARETVTMTFVADDGYTYTGPALLPEVESTLNGEEGFSFTITGEGNGALVRTPTP